MRVFITVTFKTTTTISFLVFPQNVGTLPTDAEWKRMMNDVIVVIVFFFGNLMVECYLYAVVMVRKTETHVFLFGILCYGTKPNKRRGGSDAD